MLFHSLSFAIFLPIVFICYWLFKEKDRWFVILISSYYFYMSWSRKYFLIFLFTTFITYISALLVEKAQKKVVKKWILGGTFLVCFGVLFLFKYFHFAMQIGEQLSSYIGIPFQPITLKLILPIGISFYTFQAIAYVVDVYRGDIDAQKHFGKYAAFISFFPQLVAGPIERSKHLLPQIIKNSKIEYKDMSYGLLLMAWGFYKKLVVADGLSIYVDRIYNNIYEYKGFSLMIATVLFAIQIYCDFSGYSDIAIGVARLFGIQLMTNFKSPYFSTSIKEFWSRWHISLSTWFKDYLYIPLGGNRKGKVIEIRNLLITFLVSGLWHGANITFVLWGLTHGLLQAIETILFSKKREQNKYVMIVRGMITFVIVCLAWSFFRAQNVSEVIWIWKSILAGITQPIAYFTVGVRDLAIGVQDLVLVMLSLLVLGFYDFMNLKIDPIKKIQGLRKPIRWGLYYIFILCILFMASFNAQEFVYFQF